MDLCQSSCELVHQFEQAAFVNLFEILRVEDQVFQGEIAHKLHDNREITICILPESVVCDHIFVCTTVTKGIFFSHSLKNYVASLDPLFLVWDLLITFAF